MRRSVVVAVVVFGLLVGVVPQASAAASARAYASCAALNKAYPSGVARTPKAAAAAVRKDLVRPVVNRRVYESSARLDKDRDGVTCPVPAPTTRTLSTDWGSIVVTEVAAPAPGECVDVPVVVAVGYPDLMGGLGLGLYLMQGEDETPIGMAQFEVIDPSTGGEELKPAGRYATSMSVCGGPHVFTGFEAMAYDIAPYLSGQEYTFVATTLLNGDFVSQDDYRFA